MTSLAADVLAVLRTIAPEIDPASVDPASPLTDQLDLDSMDYLRFLTALAAKFQVEIPDAVVPTLRTLDDLAGFINVQGSAG